MRFWAQAKKHHHHGAALLAGGLLATAFPDFDIAGAAWVAPGLLLACAYGRTGAAAWRIGYTGGLATWLVSLAWLLAIPVTGFPILGWVALAAFVALFPATWVWLLAGKIGHGGWLRRFFWAIGGAAAWVALEMIRARLLGGFPWIPLGASQWRLTPLIQIAAVTGVYGVSFLVVWTSLALYSGVIALLRNPTTRYVWLGEVTAPLVVVMLIFNLGSARIRNAPAPDAARQVAFIQPAIPQTMIWDPAASTNRFRQLLALTEAALTNRTDLVLWPEAALPEFTEENFAAMTDLVRTHQTWLIFGADDVRWRTNAASPEDYEVFNAAFALPPADAPPQSYHKRQLVIFGEYVPLVDWLPFIQWFTPITGSFTPGERAGAFVCDGLTIAPLICFEDTFPHHVRDHVTTNTDWLVNLTNDGWFGSGAAQRQHAATAAFRAVENGIPLLRSCNTGLTCWFDARGRMRDVWRDESGGIYGPGFANWRIEFVSTAQRGPATYYNRYGDRFGWGCVGFSVALLLWRFQLARQGRLRPAATPAASA